MEKRNLTISLQKSLIRQAKILAAAADKSLNQLLRELLEEHIRSSKKYEKAKRRQISMLKRGFDMGTYGERICTREELHDRR